MAKFSANTFKRELQNKVKESANSQETTAIVAEKAKEVMHQVIEKKVYEGYSPKVYERRGESGGLLDYNNIVASTKGNHIYIENIAEPNKSIFGTPFREDPKGLLYEWMDQGKIDDSWTPTSFTVWWTGNRMGMTEDIANDESINRIAAKAIVDNMKWGGD